MHTDLKLVFENVAPYRTTVSIKIRSKYWPLIFWEILIDYLFCWVFWIFFSAKIFSHRNKSQRLSTMTRRIHFFVDHNHNRDHDFQLCVLRIYVNLSGGDCDFHLFVFKLFLFFLFFYCYFSGGETITLILDVH